MSLEKAIKKGFSSTWESWEQVNALLPVLAKAGFHGVEPTFNSGAIPAPESSQQEIRRFREVCESLHLDIPSMRGGRAFWATIPSQHESERQKALEHGKKALDCLVELDGKTLLVVPGMRLKEMSYRDHWQRVIDFARKMGELAQERGLKVGLENVEARFPLSECEWHSLLQDIDHSAVGMYFDVGNVVWLDVGYPEQWISELAAFILQIHFKDAIRGKQLRNLLAGEVDWLAVKNGLCDIPYQGWICVEPEWYRHAPYRLAQRLSQDLDAIFRLGEEVSE